MLTVVKYSNWMNELNFSCFNATDFNLFFALCVKAREQGTDIISLSYDELRKLTNYKSTSNDRFAEDITRMNQKLMSISCMIEAKPGLQIQFNLFCTFWNDKKCRKLTVRVNPEFLFVLNDILSNYTRFDLPPFVSLNSKYSKELFKHFRQWSSVGKCSYSIDELREMLGVPKTYSNGLFYSKILGPAIEELSDKMCFSFLKCTPHYSKNRGHKVTGYTFTWKATKPRQTEKPMRNPVKVTSAAEARAIVMGTEKSKTSKASAKKISTTSFNGWMVPEDL